MKLHGPFRDVKFRRDLLVRQVLNDPLKHVLLAAADLHAGSEGPSSGQELLGTLGDIMKQRFPGDNHHLEILGRLATHQAVHREQAGNFVDGQAAVGISINAESNRA